MTVVRSEPVGVVAGRVMLMGSAVLFGSMFVPGQRAVEDLTPAGSVTLRFLIATVAILPWSFRDASELRVRRRDYLLAGGLAGAVNAVGFIVQSLGLQRTSASSAAFLSSLFVVFVPLMAALLNRRMPSRWIGAGVGMAVFGSFLLTGAKVGLSTGDLLCLGAAVAASCHILLLGHYATRLVATPFNLVQIAVVAVLAGATGLLSGFGQLTGWAFLGVLWCGLAQAAGLGLQMVAQRRVDAVSSALVFLLIPVVGAALAVVVLHDQVTAGRLAGAALIVAAVVVAEVVPLRRALQTAALVPA